MDFVLGFVYTPDGDQVLLTRKQHPEWQRGKLNGLGGRIGAGESPREAMAREGFEEAGQKFAWRDFALLYGADWRVYCFRATAPNLDRYHGTFNDAGELFEVHTTMAVILNDLLPVIPNLRWLVPMSMPEIRPEWPLHIAERYEGRPIR